MKKVFIPIIIALVLVILVSWGYSKLISPKGKIICNQQYALCTSAQCIPDPKNKNRSICFCEVYEGKSLGKTPCKKRIPKTDKSGSRLVISTFSFEGFATKKSLTCPSGNPWSDCLDQPCIVDPLNPSRAICSCKIVRTGISETFGGHCDPSTCDKGYWSGATVESNQENIDALMQEFNLTESPKHPCIHE